MNQGQIYKIEIDENYYSILSKEVFLGKEYIKEQLYNKALGGVLWVNNFFKDTHPKIFKKLEDLMI